MANVEDEQTPGPVKGAAGTLEDGGLSPTVVDARFAKPLDEQLLEQIARTHELIVTVEDNVLMGGFGSAVLESLADRDLLGETRVIRFGIPDRYVTHGKPQLLHEEVGFTPERVAERIEGTLARSDTVRAERL